MRVWDTKQELQVVRCVESEKRVLVRDGVGGIGREAAQGVFARLGDLDLVLMTMRSPERF